MVAVRGRVSYRGHAVGRGRIVFAPDSGRGSHGPLAQAEILTDGSYELYTGAVPGVAPGWYRVTVVSVEAPAPAAQGPRYSVPRSLLPEKYRDPDLSGLACEVKSGAARVVDFKLD
jgi:hypothetical protein